MTVKRGDTVRIKKGAVIGGYGIKKTVLKRSQKIKVHSVHEPVRVPIGTYTHYSDGAKFHFSQSERDLWAICDQLGIPYSHQPGEKFEALMELAMKDMQDDYGHGTCWNCYVTTSPSEVWWAGSGGYWKWTALENVETVEA